MFGSGVLDTAIGLIFVFLLVSVLVTIVNELISAVLLSRAKWLRIGMERLLGSAWAQQLYAHPLIEGSAAGVVPNAPGKAASRGSGPSYIASRSFANVLMDLVREGDETVGDARRALQDALDQATGASASIEDVKKAMSDAAMTVRPPAGIVTSVEVDLNRLLNRLPVTGADTVKWLDGLKDTAARLADPQLKSTQEALTTLVTDLETSSMDAETIGRRLEAIVGALPYVAVAEKIKRDLDLLLHRIRAGYTVGDARTDIQRFIDGMPVRYLREMIERIQTERIRKTLLVLLDDAQGDVEKFKENVEIWFNNAMDRVGGWYKRKSQWVIAFLGLVAAVGLNVDALQIVQHLETHPGVRDALVAQAKAYADNNKTPSTTGGAADGATPSRTDADLPTQFKTIESQLTQLGLPIGWVRASNAVTERASRQVVPTDRSALLDTIAFHWMGWLITALAATLGAPFWFDILNRVISIRSAGKSPEERPKPPKSVPEPLEPGQSPMEADAAARR